MDCFYRIVKIFSIKFFCRFSWEPLFFTSKETWSIIVVNDSFCRFFFNRINIGWKLFQSFVNRLNRFRFGCWSKSHLLLRNFWWFFEIWLSITQYLIIIVDGLPSKSTDSSSKGTNYFPLWILRLFIKVIISWSRSRIFNVFNRIIGIIYTSRFFW